jgi:hypothetical protein
MKELKNKKEITTPIEHNISLISAIELKARIAAETKKRKLIKEFIAKHLKEGVDYGRIHISKNCQNPHNCKNKNHYSRDILFKPGAEKFTSLFKLRAEFQRDNETFEMAGSPTGLFCYICRLYSPNNILIGEGRGACSVNEKNGSINTAIKIAEKRAKLDAILSTGALSDFFTQDEDVIEELEKEELKPTQPAGPSDTQKMFAETLKWIRQQSDITLLTQAKNRLDNQSYFNNDQKNQLKIQIEERINELNKTTI